MRYVGEFLFILLVVLLLFGWTAFRYRRQIGMVLGFGKALREARARAVNPAAARQPEMLPKRELVHCSSCGTWVPSERAIRFDAKTFYCSKECVKVAVS